jgi:predicted nucleic acid-binding protein
VIVVDNALICHLIIPGEYSEHAERVRSLDAEWVAPPLWISEFRNVLRKYIVGKRLELDQALEYVNTAERLMQGRSIPVSSVEVMALAAVSGCTAYDCEYVALAQTYNIPLVTPDKQVLKAFPETAITPEAYGR